MRSERFRSDRQSENIDGVVMKTPVPADHPFSYAGYSKYHKGFIAPGLSPVRSKPRILIFRSTSRQLSYQCQRRERAVEPIECGSPLEWRKRAIR